MEFLGYAENDISNDNRLKDGSVPDVCNWIQGFV